MLILLSCAKTMSDDSEVKASLLTVPRFQKEASELALFLSQCTANELKLFLKVNSRLAAENYLRFHNFHSQEIPLQHALFAYNGIVFKRINPSDFTKEDFRYAQSHLRFTSFLYGLLRPLDGIKSYRLEGDVRLPELNGQTIFEFWRTKLTDILIEDCLKAGGVLVNLASNEMKLLFDWKRLTSFVKVITPEFKVMKRGKLSTIVVYTKMSRGEMSRMILKKRLSDPEQLKNFNWEGFSFRPDLSDENHYLFVQDGI